MEIAALEDKNAGLMIQLDDAREELKKRKATFEAKLAMLNDEMAKYKDKTVRFQKELTTLEIENETQARQNRIKEEIIKELTHKSTKLNETLTIIKLETDEVKSIGQEEMSRMRSQLRETEEELTVLKQKRNTLVKNQMMEPKKRQKLQLHQSNVFVHTNGNKARVESPTAENGGMLSQSVIISHPQSVRNGHSSNAQANNFSKSFLSKHSEHRDKKPFDRRMSTFYGGNTNAGADEDNMQRFMSKNGECGALTDRNGYASGKAESKNKSEWFINVISSLDKKLKDIKTSMLRKS